MFLVPVSLKKDKTKTPPCRYEVEDLVAVCEAGLVSKVDSDCCVALLALADQFQAAALRRSCLQFISARPALLAQAQVRW